jgi:histone H3/H4
MAKKKGKDMLVVGSKVKEYIRAKKLMCAADVLEAVNACVCCCLDKAAARAQANGRKTVQARDV